MSTTAVLLNVLQHRSRGSLALLKGLNELREFLIRSSDFDKFRYEWSTQTYRTILSFLNIDLMKALLCLEMYLMFCQ